MNVARWLVAFALICTGCQEPPPFDEAGGRPSGSEAMPRPADVDRTASNRNRQPKVGDREEGASVESNAAPEATATEVAAGGSIGGRVRLQSSELDECSGLGFSVRRPHYVWAHNDSGDQARWLSFDSRNGELAGSCQLKGAEAVDWEDMTIMPFASQKAGSQVADDEHHRGAQVDRSSLGPNDNLLVAADCGDNSRSRRLITLYACVEPDPRLETRVPPSRWASLQVRYPDGPMDCEAVWYDEQQDVIRLLGKQVTPWASVVEIPAGRLRERLKDALAAEQNKDRTSDVAQQPTEARLITKLSLPLATAADRDPESGDVWVVSYWQAWRLSASFFDDVQSHPDRRRGVAQAMTFTPEAFPLPPWKQIEAVAVDQHSNLWISSEGESPPLGLLRIKGRP